MDYVIRKGKLDNKIIVLWVGLVLYMLGTLAEDFTDLYNVMLFKALIYSGILLSAYSIISNISLDFKNRNKCFKAVVLLMFLWYMFMFLNSDFSFFLSPQNYVLPFSMLSYTMFFMLFMDGESAVRTFLKLGYKVIYISPILFMIPLFANVSNNFLQYLLETFAVFAAFVFITNKYHSNRNILISLLVLVFAFLIATLGARRNLMLTFGLYIMIGSIVALVNGKLKTLESRIIVSVIGGLAILGAFTFYLSESTGTFSKITGRASENTREEVFMAYAIDMGNIKDLLIGRGFSGDYYSPGVDFDDVGETNDYRTVIECGYLQLILKGGIVYMIIYMSLFIGAIYYGLRGNNQFVKGMSYILMVQIIDMVPFGVHAFNVKSFMIWLAVSICYDTRIRQMSDDDIMGLLFKPKRNYLPWEK